MERIGGVEADEEAHWDAVAVQDSVPLVVPLQHQIISPSPASLQELVPPSDLEEK